MPTFDEIEQTAQRKDKIRVRCIKIPDDTDPPLIDRVLRRFEVNRIYDAEYMLDRKLNDAWIVCHTPFNRRETRKYFEVAE